MWHNLGSGFDYAAHTAKCHVVTTHQVRTVTVVGHMIYRVSFFLLVSLLCLFGSVFAAQSAPLRAGGDSQYPPYEFLDTQGRPTGFAVEMTEAVAEVMGLEIEIRLSPWEQVRSDLENGHIDLVVGMYSSPERDLLVDFSTPYLTISHSLFIRKGATPLTINQIHDKELIVQRDEIMHDYVLEKKLAGKVIPVESQADALRLLASGKHDAALLPKLQGLFLAQHYGLSNVVPAGQPFNPREYGFGIVEGNTALQNQLNEGLSLLKATGRYDEIYRRWFGVYEPRPALSDLIRFAPWIVVPVLVLLVMAFFWSWSLKREVAAKTAALSHELTERQRTEKKLQQSEERLALALKVSNEGVWDWNVQTGEVYFSPRYFTMLGYQPDEWPQSFDSWQALLHPADREQAIDSAWEHVRQGKEYQREFRLRSKGGGVVHILSRGKVVSFDGDGNPLRMVGTHMDISERKRAEQALRESEERFRAMADSAPVLIWMCDEQRSNTYFNRPWLQFTGRTLEQERGRGWIEGMHPDDLVRCEAIIRQAFEERSSYTVEYRLKRFDGVYRWILEKGVPRFSHDGAFLGFIGSGADISELRQAHNALQTALRDTEEARDRIDTILRSVADGLVVTDAQGVILMVNPAAEKLLNVQGDTMVNRPLSEVVAEPKLLLLVQQTLAGSSGGRSEEWQEPSGKRVIQARSASVQKEGKEVSGSITLLRDITREKELDRIKSEFISTAAHELRTPLTSVIGFTELLLAGRGLEPEQQSEFLTLIYEKSQTLEKIVDELLDLSRVESGRIIHLEKIRHDLCATLQRLVCQYQKECRRHVFELHIAEKPLPLLYDEGKITQVLENLLSNAVKFSPQGGTIVVTCAREDEGARVSVRDEGIGMSEAEAGRIFEKFYRADSSNTAVGGLGLGMNIVKNIIEAHEGRIWVESEPGKGTEVIFVLPLYPRAGVASA